MNEISWGIRFNEFPAYQRFTKDQGPIGCPEWLDKHQINMWQEQGLILWNNIVKKIVVLNGGKSLELLKQLESNDVWKREGVSIKELGYQFEIPIPKRGRRKKAELAIKTEETKSEPVYIEILHLPSEAGVEIIELLKKNNLIISNMADQEKERFEDAMRQLWEHLLEFPRKEETINFNFSDRAFQWLPIDTFCWISMYQDVEGRVGLDESKLFWHTCVKRKNFSSRSEYFEKFLSAIEWCEKEIIDLANQTEAVESKSKIRTEQQINDTHKRLRKKLEGGPYWIDPLDMEPKQISYNIYIEIDTKPTKFKTLELGCGDVLQVNQQFLSSSKLATSINLDIDHFNFFQPLGENSECHFITSLTTLYQETSAVEQAQKTWDQSRIVQQFKDGKIHRARYGYKEVETGFKIYLGACESPDDPWWKPETRNEHMQQLALRESISFSLNGNDFRDFLGMDTETIDDERILRIMHSTRARSKYIEEKTRIESKIWLAQHDSP